MAAVIAKFVWDPITLARRRTDTYRFEVFKADGVTGEAIASDDSPRLKVFRRDGDTPLIDIGLIATTNKSILTIVQTAAPALLDVLFAQDDVTLLVEEIYWGELSVADNSVTAPVDAQLIIAYGPIHIIATAVGTVGV